MAGVWKIKNSDIADSSNVGASGGGGGSGNAVVGEIPSGAVNGSNAAFTTAHAYLGSTTAAYRNGIRELRGVGYNESGASTITFTTAPATGDNIQVDYLY